MNPIEREARRRGIKRLIHFTRAENVDSIARHGLLPPHDARLRGIHARVNDQERFDHRPRAVGLSVSFPNYQMLYKLICEDRDCDWAILMIDPCVLWYGCCAFFPTNAASTEMAKLDIRLREDVNAFCEMFSDFDRHGRRRGVVLHAYEPTDPQAEVLAFGEVPASLIRKVAFETPAARDKWQVAINSIPSLVDRSLFRPRRDFEQWRNGEKTRISA